MTIPGLAPRAAEDIKKQPRIDQIDRSAARHPAVWIFALSLLYFALVFLSSLHKPLWLDELFTLYLAKNQPLSNLLHPSPYDTHPPPLYFLTRFAQDVFGDSDFAARLPAVFGFWMLCVGLFLFIRRKNGALFGILGFLLPIGSNAAFYYAFEARPYALLLGFSALAALYWQSVTSNSGRSLALTGLGLSLACAACTHYYAAVMLFFPIGVAEIARSLNRKRIDLGVWVAIICGLLPLAILMPPAWVSSHGITQRIRASSTFWARPTLSFLFNCYWVYFARVGTYLAGSLVVGVIIARLSGWFGSEKSAPEQPRWRPEELALAVGFLTVPIVMWMVCKFVTGYFLPRYGVTAIIGGTLILAHVATLIPRRVAVAVLLVFFLFQTAISMARAMRVEPPSDMLDASVLPSLDSAPVVIANPLVFLPATRYSSANTISRIVFVSDPQYAFQKADWIPEYSITGLRPLIPGRIEDFASFLSEHKHFWLYSTGATRLEWLPARLAVAGYYLETAAHHGDVTLIRVDAPSSATQKP